jgi:hypothetical protein
MQILSIAHHGCTRGAGAKKASFPGRAGLRERLLHVRANDPFARGPFGEPFGSVRPTEKRLPMSGRGLLFALVLASAPARAEDPPAAQPEPESSVRWELAAKAVYTSPPIRGGTTPFGAGFGGRFGLVVSNLYVGVSVVDYLGGTDIDLSDHAVLYGGELGYGFRVALDDARTSFFVVRPQVGVGGMTLFHVDPSLLKKSSPDVVTSASGRSSRSDTTMVDSLYLEPAVTVLYASSSYFGGVGANMLVLPNIQYSGAEPSTWLSYGIEMQGGLRF